jgi:hypothetical protein
MLFERLITSLLSESGDLRQQLVPICHAAVDHRPSRTLVSWRRGYSHPLLSYVFAAEDFEYMCTPPTSTDT